MKLLRRIGENLPAIFFFIIAVLSAVTGDYGTTRFSIIMAILFFVLKDLYEIKTMLKKKE
jgi:hypothetical protein